MTFTDEFIMRREALDQATRFAREYPALVNAEGGILALARKFYTFLSGKEEEAND